MVLKLVILGLLSGGITWLATHAFRRVAWRYDILDHPTDRKVHLHPIPYLGGMAIFVGITVSIAFAPRIVPETIFHLDELQTFLIGALVVVLLGIIDDLADVSSLVKLAVTIGVGVFMYARGFQIVELSTLEGIVPLRNGHQWLAALMTVAWYVVIMNAINIVDGLDGLAAGLCAIAALMMTIMSLSWSDPSPLALVLAVAIGGSCLGFLPHNWPPARIFMGDTGSLLLGLALASMTVFGRAKASVLSTLVIPVLLLGIPIVDIGYAFVRRLAEGKNPFRADRLHLHHRMMALGLPTKRILGLFYYLTAYLGLLAYMLQEASSAIIVVNALLLGIGFLLLLSTLRSLDKSTARGDDA